MPYAYKLIYMPSPLRSKPEPMSFDLHPIIIALNAVLEKQRAAAAAAEAIADPSMAPYMVRRARRTS